MSDSKPSRETESDLWEWLDAQPNKQGYVKRLIREDMERGREA